MQPLLITIKSVCVVLCYVLMVHAAYAGDIVYLNTPSGVQRLEQSDLNHQYVMVAPYVDTQENLGFCGPASMAAALNSLPGVQRPKPPQLEGYSFFTQRDLFTPQSSQVKSYEAVANSGFVLQEASAFLTQLNVSNRVMYGSDLDKDQLRAVIKSTLAKKNDRLIVDFDRRVLHQKGSGHYSPIGAYDSATDSVLILDVAKFKYPPFWVEITDLYEAIRTIDPSSGRSRGLLILGAQG